MQASRRVGVGIWLAFACWTLPELPSLAQMREGNESEILRATAGNGVADNVDPAAVAGQIVERTNEFRKSEGLQPLETDSRLRDTAQYFADYMARTDRYGHGADGKRPAERVAEHGYDYCLVTENIAYAFESRGYSSEELAEEFFTGWKNSPGHRENMLDPDVQETGVAVARSEKSGYWYGVQVEARPKSAAVEFRIENVSDTAITYSIGKRSFELPPHYERMHEQCRSPQLSFAFRPGEEETERLQPQNGDRYAVVREGGQLKVEETE